VLKGGALIYAIGGITTRFTKDLDFLGKDKIKSQAKLKEIISQIASIPFPTDGVCFDPGSIVIEPLKPVWTNL
jgi:predicted nucleotidyltransferase component of viral defense system